MFILESIANLSDNIYSWIKNFIGFESIVSNKIDELNERIKQMALNLDALTAEVTRVTTVQASAVTLLKNLTAELEDISAKLAATPPPVAPEVIDTKPIDDLVAKLKDSTDALAGAVASSADVKGTKEVILNADDLTKPTVKVVLPEVLPPVVEAKPEVVVDTVDTTSPEPQVVITVAPATDETHELPNVVTDTIKTEDNLTDVTVHTDAELHDEVKTESGVDTSEAVKDAYEAAPEVTAAPADAPAEPAPV